MTKVNGRTVPTGIDADKCARDNFVEQFRAADLSVDAAYCLEYTNKYGLHDYFQASIEIEGAGESLDSVGFDRQN